MQSLGTLVPLLASDELEALSVLGRQFQATTVSGFMKKGAILSSCKVAFLLYIKAHISVSYR